MVKNTATTQTATQITNKLPPDVDPLVSLPISDDIVEDILRRVIAMAPGFTAALAKQVEEGVRADWGGQRAYIGQRRGDVRNERNAAIRADFYMRGEHFGLLERRYGLSKKQLYRIVYHQPLETPP